MEQSELLYPIKLKMREFILSHPMQDLVKKIAHHGSCERLLGPRSWGVEQSRKTSFSS
jgi:hypothetical protein